MKYAIIYASGTGNTKSLADSIKVALPAEECVYFGEPNLTADLQCELIFAGFWTDKGTCCDKITDFLKLLENKKVVLFGTAGFNGSQEYYSGILKKSAANLQTGNTYVDGFMCQGKMPTAVRNRYEIMEKQSEDPSKAKALIENFDKALGHPDINDLFAVRKFVKDLHIELQ